MNWHDEQVLVTGAGGFLGRRLVERLRTAGCRGIRGFGRSPQPDLSAEGIDFVQGDLRDADAIARACANRTIVFHTAAKAGIWGSKRDYFGINVEGTENVIAACREANVPRLIHTSSPSVAYPPTRDIENLDESAPYPDHFLAHYPHSKAIAERRVLAANSDTLKTVALRPHLIWGPNDPHLLPRLLRRAKMGRLMIVGDGRAKVDLTHVDNAAEAHVKAAAALTSGRCPGGKAYFISDGAPVVLWDWINNLLERCDIEPVKRKISHRTAHAAGTVLEWLYRLFPLPGDPPMTRFVAGQLAFSHFFNLAAAQKDLDYQPVVDPNQALDETVQWARGMNHGT